MTTARGGRGGGGAGGDGGAGGAAGPVRHSVWGRVVTPADVAVPGAEVFWVAGEHAGRETVELFDVHIVAKTDGEGRFWAPSLPSGACVLVPDYRRMGREGDRFRVAHGTAVTLPLAEGEEVDVVFPFERREFGSIHGVIRDPLDRRPASRLTVVLVDVNAKSDANASEGRDAGGEAADAGAGRTRAAPLQTVKTGTNGKFSFEFLHAGRYRVALCGTRRHLEGTAEFELGLNKRLDLKIDQPRRPDGPRGAVGVRVEDRLGLPIADARVTLTAENLDVAPQQTDADGCTRFAGLPVRPVAVTAVAPGFWHAGTTLPPGEVSDAANVVVTLQRTVTLRVGARDAETGRALRHVNILVNHEGGDLWVWGGALPPPNAPPREHNDVQVRLGRVTFRAESPDYVGAQMSRDIGAEDDGTSLVLRLSLRRPDAAAS